MINDIYTTHLHLRTFTEKDITPLYLSALNDPAIVGLTEARHRHWTPKDATDYVKNSNQPGTSDLIGIFLKTNEKHIGNIRLFNYHPVHKRCELGIMIYDKTQWSKGYGTEAILGIETHVFHTLHLHKICADYYENNTGSAHMFKKAGYSVEGVFKDHFYLHDHFVDSIRIAKFNPQEQPL